MANKCMNILVTGSAGFLGAPLAFDLLSMGHKIIGIDSYVNSNSENTLKLEENFKENYVFYKLDIASDSYALDAIFIEHKPELVLHLAALKSVQESISNPILYKKNNIGSTANIINSMKSNDCKKIIYSSSAAVYGNQEIQPIKENTDLKPISTYADTKLACEKLIEDACKASYIDGIALRYFNPVGFHSSHLFKEFLNETDGTIMQEIIKVALRKNKSLKIYGNNYATKDGTCERDFIHIDDLMDAHIKSIDYINSSSGYDVFNVGTGNPISILNLTKSFIEINNILIDYEFTQEKSGDIGTCYADTSKITKLMKWKSKKNLKHMIRDSWVPYSTKSITKS